MSQPSSKPRELLDGLKEAHASVRECLDEMKGITSRNQVNRLELTNARFRISRASLNRRTIFNAACNEIARDGAAHEKTVIRDLRQFDLEMGSKSAAHVAHWTSERIEFDWSGYCAASQRLRAEMAVHLTTQEALLWPMLSPSRQRRGTAQLREGSSTFDGPRLSSRS